MKERIEARNENRMILVPCRLHAAVIGVNLQWRVVEQPKREKGENFSILLLLNLKTKKKNKEEKQDALEFRCLFVYLLFPLLN